MRRRSRRSIRGWTKKTASRNSRNSSRRCNLLMQSPRRHPERRADAARGHKVRATPFESREIIMVPARTPLPNYRRDVASALAVFVAATDFAYSDRAKEDSSAPSGEKCRQACEADLKSDTGWLTISGLFWLREGENRFA